MKNLLDIYGYYADCIVGPYLKGWMVDIEQWLARLGHDGPISGAIYIFMVFIALIFDLIILVMHNLGYFNNTKTAQDNTTITWNLCNMLCFYSLSLRHILPIVISVYSVCYHTYPDPNSVSFYQFVFSLATIVANGLYLIIRRQRIWGNANPKTTVMVALGIIISDIPFAILVYTGMPVTIQLMIAVNMTIVVSAYHCSQSAWFDNCITKWVHTVLWCNPFKTTPSFGAQTIKQKYLQSFYGFLVFSKIFLWACASFYSEGPMRFFEVTASTPYVLLGIFGIWCIWATRFMMYAALCYQHHVTVFAAPLEPLVLFEITALPQILKVLLATLRLNTIREYRQVLKNVTPVTPMVILTHSMTIVSVSKCNKTHWTVFVIMRQWVIYLDNRLYVLAQRYTFFVVVRKVLRQGTRHLLRRAGYIRGFVKTFANPLVLKTAKHLNPMWMEEVQKYTPSLDHVVLHMTPKNKKLMEIVGGTAAMVTITGITSISIFGEISCQYNTSEEFKRLPEINAVAKAIGTPEALASAGKCSEGFTRAMVHIRKPDARLAFEIEGVTGGMALLDQMIPDPDVKYKLYKEGRGFPKTWNKGVEIWKELQKDKQADSSEKPTPAGPAEMGSQENKPNEDTSESAHEDTTNSDALSE